MASPGTPNHMTKYQFWLIGFVAMMVLVLGTVAYHHIEDMRWIDALYFSTITLTTIGYGDITPQTDAGKLFTVFYVLVGVSIIGAFINAILRRAASRRHERHNK